MNNQHYPGFPVPSFIDAPDGKIAVYQAGDIASSKMPIVLVHGWPEIAYCWKNQIDVLAQQGHYVIALDLKGFGWSDAPEDPNLYDIIHMTNDLAAVLDALKIKQAIFCGHDWGGAIVWPMALLHPKRVAGVIGVCTPHLPPPPVSPLSIIRRRFGAKHYFVQFQEREKAEKIFTGEEEKFFRIMFRKPVPKENWAALIPRIYDLPGRLLRGPLPSLDDVIVSHDVIDVYINAYRQSGC